MISHIRKHLGFDIKTKYASMILIVSWTNCTIEAQKWMEYICNNMKKIENLIMNSILSVFPSYHMCVSSSQKNIYVIYLIAID